jgi:predicted Zn-dependent protease
MTKLSTPRAKKDHAHALVQKGKLKDALTLFSELAQETPSDVALWLQCAQLAKRLNQPTRAVTAWWTAAKLLNDAGHQARARAAVICALELAPNDLNLRRALETWRDGMPVLLRMDAPVAEEEEPPTDPLIPIFEPPVLRPHS